MFLWRNKKISDHFGKRKEVPYKSGAVVLYFSQFIELCPQLQSSSRSILFLDWVSICLFVMLSIMVKNGIGSLYICYTQLA